MAETILIECRTARGYRNFEHLPIIGDRIQVDNITYQLEMVAWKKIGEVYKKVYILSDVVPH